MCFSVHKSNELAELHSNAPSSLLCAAMLAYPSRRLHRNCTILDPSHRGMPLVLLSYRFLYLLAPQPRTPQTSAVGKDAAEMQQRHDVQVRLSHRHSLSGCLAQANRDLKKGPSVSARLRRSHTGNTADELRSELRDLHVALVFGDGLRNIMHAFCLCCVTSSAVLSSSFSK